MADLFPIRDFVNIIETLAKLLNVLLLFHFQIDYQNDGHIWLLNKVDALPQRRNIRVRISMYKLVLLQSVRVCMY